MGLLDAKTRVMDTLLTEEGRLQLSRGKMRIAYAAFSDGATYYELDAVSGSSDATRRIYAESRSLPQDQVTLKADDTGQLAPFRNLSGLDVISGKLVSGSSLVPANGTQFASLAGKLLNSSVENFQALQLIGTINRTFDDEEFELNRSAVKFVLTPTNPRPTANIGVVRIEELPGFLQDPRLSHVRNFRYLPPVIRTDAEENVVRLGHTVPQGSIFKDDRDFLDALKKGLASFEKSGAHVTVTADPTSHNNNIFMQMFEVNPDGTLVKLDVLTFGGPQAGGTVYFVGKVVMDEGDFKFINIFTLTLD